MHPAPSAPAAVNGGGAGDENITGGAGNDVLIGDGATDRMVGSAEHDILAVGDWSSDPSKSLGKDGDAVTIVS
jgi:Ca2+-binding RTX toxin-like protein